MERSSHEPFAQTVSHAEILEVVDRLLAGTISREQASAWAGQALPAVETLGHDPLAEEVLDCLLAIDQIQTDSAMEVTGYLFDFAELLTLRRQLAG